MTIATSAVLSAQEAAIESGRKILHGTATDQVIRLCDAVMASCSPRVALDRAVLFTESFKETENQPMVLRWAKALRTAIDEAVAG